ncbi:MAG: hypothetical protein J6W52_02855 [Bacteroidaceae bacterium]|nr:hypothetical protein [Bacteroidaceae bacterium]
MKSLFSALFLSLLSVIANAQNVKVETDDFTGEKVITTDYLKVYQGGATAENQTRIRFRHENGKDYIEYRIFTDDAISSCKEGQTILIKTDDGIIETVNTENTVAEPGAWSAKPINDNYGIYIICTFSPYDLQGKTIQKIRINLTSGYTDLNIKAKDAGKFQQLLTSFLDAKK